MNVGFGLADHNVVELPIQVPLPRDSYLRRCIGEEHLFILHDVVDSVFDDPPREIFVRAEWWVTNNRQRQPSLKAPMIGGRPQYRVVGYTCLKEDAKRGEGFADGYLRRKFTLRPWDDMFNLHKEEAVSVVDLLKSFGGLDSNFEAERCSWAEARRRAEYRTAIKAQHNGYAPRLVRGWPGYAQWSPPGDEIW